MYRTLQCATSRHDDTMTEHLKPHLRPVSMRFEDYDFDANGIINFFWPCNRMNMVQVRDAMLDELRTVHATLLDNDNAARLAIELLGLAWTMSLCRITHAQILVEDFSEVGKVPINVDDFPLLEALQVQRQPGDEAYVKELLRGGSSQPRWRWPFRLARQAILRPVVPTVPLRVVDLKKTTVTTSVGGLIDKRAAVSDKPVVHCDAAQWFKSVSVAPEDDVLAGATDAIMAAARNVVQRVGVKLSDIAECWFRRQVQRSSAAAMKQWIQLRDGRLPIPRWLWVGSMSRVWPRLLARAVIEAHGEVDAHDHGSGSGRFIPTGATYLLKGFCQRFVTFSRAQADIMELNFNRYGFATSVQSVCEVAEGTELNMTVADKVAFGGIPKRPTVLIEPFVCAREVMHSVPVPDDIIVADFNVRLAAVLAASGCKVRFKPHPGPWGFLNTRHLKNRLGVEVIGGSFDEAVAASDVILFCHPFTSTLAATIKIDKPIVLMDCNVWHWAPAALDALKKRCAIVTLGEDDNHHLQCDWGELTSSIRASYLLNDPLFEQQFLASNDA